MTRAGIRKLVIVMGANSEVAELAMHGKIEEAINKAKFLFPEGGISISDKEIYDLSTITANNLQDLMGFYKALGVTKDRKG